CRLAYSHGSRRPGVSHIRFPNVLGVGCGGGVAGGRRTALSSPLAFRAMPLGRLAIAAVALSLIASVAAAAALPGPSTLAACAPASAPSVVFPFSAPDQRSGRGAILWLGGAPSCSGR